jgi:hypothetical protein
MRGAIMPTFMTGTLTARGVVVVRDVEHPTVHRRPWRPPAKKFPEGSAKPLGLDVPATLLARVDEVIELVRQASWCDPADGSPARVSSAPQRLSRRANALRTWKPASVCVGNIYLDLSGSVRHPYRLRSSRIPRARFE